MESIDGQYGVDESSGMIGMLARGEIDIAIADFNPSATRWLGTIMISQAAGK